MSRFLSLFKSDEPEPEPGVIDRRRALALARLREDPAPVNGASDGKAPEATTGEAEISPASLARFLDARPPQAGAGEQSADQLAALLAMLHSGRVEDTLREARRQVGASGASFALLSLMAVAFRVKASAIFEAGELLRRNEAATAQLALPVFESLVVCASRALMLHPDLDLARLFDQAAGFVEGRQPGRVRELSAPPARPEPIVAPATVRFDGLYQSECGSPGARENFWHYFRFYEDGTVLTAVSGALPDDLRFWFCRENPEIDRGSYTLRGPQIELELRGYAVTRATAAPDVLVLDNNERYQFVPVHAVPAARPLGR